MSYSIEKLFHFQCPVCEKWWTIGDAEPGRNYTCPWCGKLSADTISKTTTGPDGLLRLSHMMDFIDLGMANRMREYSDSWRADVRALDNARIDHVDANKRNIRANNRVDQLLAAIKSLLQSHGCLVNDKAEIPEELSARFDVPLESARQVVAAVNGEVQDVSE